MLQPLLQLLLRSGVSLETQIVLQCSPLLFGRTRLDCAATTGPNAAPDGC